MFRQRFSAIAAALAAVALAVGMSAVQAKSTPGGSALNATGSRVDRLVSQRAPVTRSYDVSGIDSFDFLGDPLNVVTLDFLGANAHVVGIGYDLTIETVGYSYLSEAVISFTDVAQSTGVFLTAGYADTFSGTGSYSSGGIHDLVGLGLDFRVGADGRLRLEFFESLDDNPYAVDAHYLGGSTLYVQFQPVPEASTYAMTAFGLAGLGFVVRRRRV